VTLAFKLEMWPWTRAKLPWLGRVGVVVPAVFFIFTASYPVQHQFN
jgi:hypothetical protein